MTWGGNIGALCRGVNSGIESRRRQEIESEKAEKRARGRDAEGVKGHNRDTCS